MKFQLALLYSLFFTATLSGQSPLIMYPSLSSDGSKAAFSYQGDIWSYDVATGHASRLTVHEAYESRPQWSPDDQHIVFQSNRYGNYDIFVMDQTGSYPYRLTYHSTDDVQPKWRDVDDIIFMTDRGFAQVEREDEIHGVSIQGGTPVRVLDAVGLSASISTDGRIALVRGNCRIAREAYTGPTNRDIWVTSSITAGDVQYADLISDDSQDILPDWAGETLYFLSARSGRYNIYRTTTASSEVPEQLTFYDDEGITYFDVSHDGQKIIYTKGGKTYIMDAEPRGQVTDVDPQLPEDVHFDLMEQINISGNINEYAISPDGKYAVVASHGELFLKINEKDKKRLRNLTKHPYRDRDPVWVNDSTIIFSSDRDGSFDLYRLTARDNGVPLYQSFGYDVHKLTGHHAEEENLVISPDRSKLLYQRGRGQLVMVDVDTLGGIFNERLLQDGWDAPGGVSWSPDSKWIAYALSDLDFNEEIYIQPADMSRPPTNVSLHPRGDRSPVWSPDGSKLGFVSERNNDDADIWFVWLKKSDWDKTQRDWEDEDYWMDEDEKSDSLVVDIDFDNIHRRLVQVTSLTGREGSMAISKDGETFYFSSSGGKKPSYNSVKWDGEDMTTILSDTRIYGVVFGPEQKMIYGLSRGGLVSVDPKGKKKTSMPISGVMTLDHMAEREQVFEEAWRRLRDGFYDPEFHGRDWAQLKSEYKDRCMSASTTQDFRVFINEMLGQLNASHMGVRGGSPEDTQSDRTGLLGVDVEPITGGVRIKGVIAGTPADREDSKLSVGDVITAINNVPLSSTTNMYSLLNGQTNERTSLSVRRSSGITERVVIRPIRSIRGANYEAWVQKRRDLTEEYSGGRLGYIHVQGMNWPSFERFERELTASGLGKDGIVIDVRYNGGGWTTDMLMTVLNVRQHAFTIPRGAAASLEVEKDNFRENYPYGERLPLSSWTKPSIALCNENSYSNAEIFSHAYQSLGHGTLVGQPTFGAVISTGGVGLLDGSFVRMPFRAWYVKSTNKNMELGPAVPDVIVENLPDSKAKGQDPQLKKAVEVLLGQIEQR